MIQNLFRKLGFTLIRNVKYINLLLEKERISNELDHASIKLSELNTIHESISALAGSDFPIYVGANKKTYFNSTHVEWTEKVLVLSIPKAGTYMMGEILKRLRFKDSGVHAAKWGFADLRFDHKSSILKNLAQKNKVINLSDYIQLVRSGEYVLSHLPADPEVFSTSSDFKSIFLIRDLRDCFVSFMRYSAQNGFGSAIEKGWSSLDDKRLQMEMFAELDGSVFFDLANPMLGWLNESDVLTVRYEDIVGDNGDFKKKQVIEEIAKFTTGNGSLLNTEDIEAIKSTETITSSGKRTEWKAYWSDKVDEIFRNLGGHDLNRIFGYHD
ncbi:sulfotransferase domain-containing protein [Cohnella herbarum]|uniref:Sulfotransferase domain-containing protein n=1 Tax=Cohnella herbarum TaxID=2728023 RepID=A0A7Z2VLI3_9BACL|nr:sulfotransferase domain-containing protein [Cohnella herbarum]QJD85262.1 sulfotransferase domain-containing protein [Cohnella herbarum]